MFYSDQSCFILSIMFFSGQWGSILKKSCSILIRNVSFWSSLILTNHVPFWPIMFHSDQSCFFLTNHVSFWPIMFHSDQSCSILTNHVSFWTIKFHYDQSCPILTNHVSFWTIKFHYDPKAHIVGIRHICQEDTKNLPEMGTPLFLVRATAMCATF